MRLSIKSTANNLGAVTTQEGARANTAALQQTRYLGKSNRVWTDMYGTEKRHRLPELAAGPGKGQVNYRVDTKPLGIARLDAVNRNITRWQSSMRKSIKCCSRWLIILMLHKLCGQQPKSF